MANKTYIQIKFTYFFPFKHVVDQINQENQSRFNVDHVD